ncbi:MAG: hypothetical protein ISR21_08715, partial [Candidatus Poseidoniaceae archaeon]|nr:hypothetical protein [Candidatus Poseidoniaceae archaeon]
TPQVIGATGMAINGIMDLTKVGFAAQMINQDMNTTQAGTATTGDLCKIPVPVVGMTAVACDTWANLAEGQWSSSDTGLGVIGANLQAGHNLSTTYGNWSSGDLDNAMDNTSSPVDAEFNMSLTNPIGLVAFMGMGAPETLLSDVLADPANSTVMQRAGLYRYATADPYQTFVRDWTMFAGIGASFQAYGGGADFNATNNDDITSRLHNLLGVDFTGANGIALMVAGHLTDTPTGLIATNADETGFGLAAFLTMEVPDAMAAFNLTVEQYTAVATWAGGWATSATSAQLGLLGGVGTMNAEQFVNQTFGGMSPVGDPYLTNSLNMGGAWGAGMIPGHADATPVSISQAQAGNMLYGPLGLTTSTGATLFLYGELSGMTPPVNLMTMEPAAPMTWNASTIGLLYGVDENTAEAMSLFVSSPIFADFVPGFLMSSFGTTPYLTQEFNNWLLGWHDPVSAFLASGNPMDMTVGWTSLESNATFYGSGGIVSDTGTDYMICTGEVSTCDKGEMMAIDGSSYFAWKDPAKTVNTFGLITAESRTGTTGGFLTGSGDMVDLSGYATAAITCDGTSTLKDIAVDDCSASLDPLERPIQAKLLDTDTLLDALPGALPVYFGSEVSLQAEQLSGAIIAGSSESTFWLDMRPITDQHTAPNASHLQAVFMITSSSEIGDADAEDLASSVTTNQKALTYWTNFDVPTDFLAPLLLIGAIACLGLGVKMMGEEDAEKAFESAPPQEESADEPAADAEESTE